MKKIFLQRYIYQSKGFTLIESLMYFSMLGIMIMVMGSVLFQVLLGRAKAETIQEVSQNARIITERMSDRIRNAQSITNPGAGQTTSSLSMTMTDTSKNPTTFDVSSGSLRIKEGSSAAQEITSDGVQITNISFTNVSHTSTPGAVRIQITLAASGTSLLKEYTYQETFYTTATIRPK